MCYSKLIQSGDLAKEHFDYGVGFYDLKMYYFQNNSDLHYCRVYFATIDDGDFGSCNEFETKDEAIKLLEKIVNKFKEINKCPSSEKLNLMFRNIGVYFTNE